MKRFNEHSILLQEQIAGRIHREIQTRLPEAEQFNFSPKIGEVLRAINPEINTDPAYPEAVINQTLDIMEALNRSAGVEAPKDNMRVVGRKYIVWLRKEGAGHLWKFDRVEESFPAQKLTITIDRVRFDGKNVEIWAQEGHLFPQTTGGAYHLSTSVETLEWAINDADYRDRVYTSGLKGLSLRWGLLGSNYNVVGFVLPSANDEPTPEVQAFLDSLGPEGSPERAAKTSAFLEQVRQDVNDGKYTVPMDFKWGPAQQPQDL